MSKTSFFTSVTNGIVNNAKQRLNITDEQCDEAFRHLTKAAYKCMCDDKLECEDNLNIITVQLGFLKQQRQVSLLLFKEHNRHIFIHIMVMKYLTERYIVSECG